ncbi:MAG TPA: Na+/H+ antiporter NhaC family protein [Gemmatimonadales bacterium]|nr:Na+/H+ antiporter NhaC family protein [Gemmatimonadales bacterium]
MPEPVSARKPHFSFPHPLALIVGCILLAAALTWILPAGKYERREDAPTGRSVVVAGTYARVDPRPVGPLAAVVSIPKGIIDAAPVIALIFLIGGGFTVVERTGTFLRLVNVLVARLKGRSLLVIPVASVAFALGGIMMQMQEELIAFVPVLLLLVRQLGYTPVTAVAMSLGAAAVGAAFSPVNPFQVIIAQKVAELPTGSGIGFRLAFLVPALVVWIAGTMYYARRSQTAPESLPAGERVGLHWRDLIVLISILGAFGLYVYGAQRLGWEFNELSALFFIVGVLAGVLGRLGIARTTEAFVDGFRSMALAALLVGFARAIYVVLNEGQIVDTIVHGLFTPIAGLPPVLAALGMMVLQLAMHVPVPSTSSQAVLTLPLLVPLSDLIGLSRQVTVLAYQYGAGLCDIISPTNGALMAMLAAAGVRYEDWFRFMLPICAVLLALGGVAVAVAVSVGLR